MRRGSFQTAGRVGELHRAPPDGSRRELEPSGGLVGRRRKCEDPSGARLRGWRVLSPRLDAREACQAATTSREPNILGAENGGHQNAGSRNRWEVRQSGVCSDCPGPRRRIKCSISPPLFHLFLRSGILSPSLTPTRVKSCYPFLFCLKIFFVEL